MKRNAGLWVVAAARWVDAVNAPRGVNRLAEACVATMVVERMGVFNKQNTLAEMFRGTAEVSRWLNRLPDGIYFELAGGPEPAPKAGADVRSVRYLYRIPELQFTHGGEWLMRLGDDGRLAWLRHHPDPLSDEMSAGGHDHGGHEHSGDEQSGHGDDEHGHDGHDDGDEHGDDNEEQPHRPH